MGGTRPSRPGSTPFLSSSSAARMGFLTPASKCELISDAIWLLWSSVNNSIGTTRGQRLGYPANATVASLRLVTPAVESASLSTS